MGRINIYSTSGSNKASLEYDGASDVTVDTAHLTGTSSNVQTQLNTNATAVQNVITKSATEPSSPSNGDFWYNTSTTSFYFYDGSSWQLIKQSFAATGGSVTEAQGYRIHTFTSSGTFTVTKGQAEVEYVVVGGGGAGGADDGGGGGAGGYRSSVNGEPSGGGASAENKLLVTQGSYTVTIGAGCPGVEHPGNRTTSQGGDTTFGSITAAGGGMGGHTDGIGTGYIGSPGGSGGGNHQAPNDAPAGSGTTGQGYAGGRGDGNLGSTVYAGGGGGAAEAGNTDGLCHGGDGVQTSITGTPTHLAGGGGGGHRLDSSSRPGGNGGGGNGSHLTTANTGSAGAANTGGGGGGGPGTGSAYERRGHPGGSGIVIIRYPI